MSRPATIDSLLGLKAKENCNTLQFKNGDDFSQKNQNILQKLVVMGTFEQISKWVETNSENQKFIANPTNASDTDRLCCLFAVQEPLVRALKPIEKRRKNGRDKHLLEAAAIGDYFHIANILASTAWTYWQNHGFQIEANGRMHISATYESINSERNLEKIELQKAQIQKIGAVLGFEKAWKKGALQEVFDYQETEEILKNFDCEDE